MEGDLTDADLQRLNRFPEELFGDFASLAFKFLLNPQDSEAALGDLDRFASSINANVGTMKSLMKSMLSFFWKAAKKRLAAGLLKEYLEQMGLSAEKVICIADLWKENYPAVCKIFATQTFTVNRLVDMDWKFGVTAGTSDMQNVGHSFLQLKVVIDRGNKQMENLHLELSLPQFYSFLHEMEKAKASLDLIS